jgi:signal transduction histidine kinase
MLQSHQAETISEVSRRFESYLARLSATLINAPEREIDSNIAWGLQQVMEDSALDGAGILELVAASMTLQARYRYSRPGVPAPPISPLPSGKSFPWYAVQLSQGHTVCLTHRHEFPAEAVAEKQHWLHAGLQSFLAIPLPADGAVVYVIAVASWCSEHTWTEEAIVRLQLLGNLCVSALIRKQHQAKLERHLALETLVADLSTVFAKVPASDIDLEIEDGLRYVVDCLGVDQSSLLEFSADHLHLEVTHSYTGSRNNHVSVSGPCLQPELPWFAAQLLRGEIVHFQQLDELPEAAVLTQKAGLMQEMKAALLVPVAVSGAPVCALGVATLCSEVDWPPEWIPFLRLIGEIFANALVRKRAEEASSRLWHELAHAARVAMLGELTASVAHEINQPLAGILNNAQAAQRFLAMQCPDLAEVREALTDIIADDQRAGKIVQQLRTLGKKSVLERVPLNLHTLVQQVIHLVQRNALEKRVTLALDLTADLPPVYGDRIQLQQVILNLVLNAFDAMQQTTSRLRVLAIRTVRQAASAIVVSFQDTGTGMDETTMQHMFTAFFTTKPEGMGMGLAVSRAIVEAHGGRIWAEPNADYGTTVCFTLPTHGEGAV